MSQIDSQISKGRLITDCWSLKRVWKKVASQGKVSEKSGNLDIDIEWQPCKRQEATSKEFELSIFVSVFVFNYDAVLHMYVLEKMSLEGKIV